MKAQWIMDKKIVENFKKLYEEKKNSDIVRERIDKNINKKNINLSRDYIWTVLIGCQITTQQKSGKDSVTSNFLNSNNRILKYKNCLNESEISISSELKNNGLRRNNNIAKYMMKILNYLESEVCEGKNGWDILEEKLESLKKSHTREDELKVLDYILGKNKKAKIFPGLGPKQSRNFIQWLGLSLYEIPIDSRALKVLEKCGCNFVPDAGALLDEKTYLFLEEGIQALAKELEIKPCVLDACFFSTGE